MMERHFLTSSHQRSIYKNKKREKIGFYSKDAILELAYTNYTISGNFGAIEAARRAIIGHFHRVSLFSFQFLDNGKEKK